MRRLPLYMLLAGLLVGACRAPTGSRDDYDIPVPPPPPYRAVDLGTLGGDWTVPFAINDSGVIVGTSERPDHSGNGFAYRNGVMRELSLTRGAFQDDRNGIFGINGSGQIAGADREGEAVLVWDPGSATSHRVETGRYPTPPPTQIIGVSDGGDILVHLDDNHYDQRAVLVKDGISLDIGGFGTTRAWTVASAWNARGQIVGSSRVRHIAPTYEIFHPFVWENGTMRDLGVLGSYPCGDDPQSDCGQGAAVDINAQGVIVGTTTMSGGIPRITVWESGAMRELEAFSGSPTTAFAINDRGQILGTVAGPGFGFFVWDQGVVQRCGEPGSASYAYGFGENGEVIGEMQVDGVGHAFVCQGGRMLDLGPGRARAINRRGDIVGTSSSRGILWMKTGSTSSTP